MTHRWQDNTLILDCHLQPGAKTTAFCGVHGDAIKIRISAPPVEGKANQQLIEFFSNCFGVTKQQVQIIKGQKSRQKRVAIERPNSLPTELSIEWPTH